MEKNRNKEKIQKLSRKMHIVTGIVIVLVILAAAFALGARWVMKTWPNLSMSELMYQLSAPMNGTNPEMIKEAVMECVLPTLLIACVAGMIFWIVRGRRKVYMTLLAVCTVLSSTVLYWTKHDVWNTLAVDQYINYQKNPSEFIEHEYADPRNVSLTFPEKKRNLIYIYLESVETTYADTTSGGGMNENYIPKLTEIARENEDFSGMNPKLNGAYSLPYTTFTMGAMFGQTSGLPLKNNLENNDMVTQSKFFEGAECLGDILAENGYSNTLMIGSDASFGGRRLYFQEHGNYDIEDYMYAKQTGMIPEDYLVFWGYEDAKLFDFAKRKITDLAGGDEPFNMTLLTVDTHFEDGYVCQDCGNQYSDQYGNVIACSDARVSAFLDWCKSQPWYEDTTIVLAGDHPTMDSDFTLSMAEGYQRRAYTAYVNSAVSAATDQYRTYSTLDHFPTTLAAMGVKIEGERLGLGTNLFSDRPTLLEEYGLSYVTEELNKKSEFMEELADIDFSNEELKERQAQSYYEDHGKVVYD